MRKKVVIGIVVFVMACVLFGAVVSTALHADAERKGLGFATSEQNTYSERHENENILASKTIYVPDDYQTIQQAVNNASTGDTIIVRDGTYVENIDINKRLTIKSENGSAYCIVQAANKSDHVFEITADYVAINGFTVKESESGAGICLNESDFCEITNNHCSDNGDGVYLSDSNGNEIKNNTCSYNEGNGTYLFDSSENEIKNNTYSHSALLKL